MLCFDWHTGGAHAAHKSDYDQLLEQEELAELMRIMQEQDDDGDSFDPDEASDKSQLTALLLSLFLGQLGAGRFYVGDVGLGSAKLLLTLGPCFLGCFACVYMGCSAAALTACFSKSGDGASAQQDGDAETVCVGCTTIGVGCLLCLACLVPFAIMGWWIADVVMFASNDILDGDGKMLIPM